MQFRYADPGSFPRIDVDPAETAQDPVVALEPPGANRSYIRLPPAFNDDPDGVDLFDLRGPITLIYPPAFTASLRHARLVGWRTFLTRDARFFTDEIFLDDTERNRHLARLALADPFNNENTGLRREDIESGFTLDAAPRPEGHITERVLCLTSSEPTSYGAFLFRVLPKLAAFQGDLANTPVLTYAPGASFQHLLALAGVDLSRLIQHDFTATYRLDHAVIPGLRNPHGFLDEASVRFFADLRARFGSKPTGRRLYVSRLNYTGSERRMLNEAKLVARLAAIGFEIVEPQWMTGDDQLRTFSSASLVVGPCGSGLFNTVFCHPGTKLINIQSEPGWIHQYCCLHTSSQLEYGIFQAKAAYGDPHNPHKPFTVNIEALLDRISAFAAA